MTDVDVEAFLTSVERAAADADATLSTDIGSHRERTAARLWKGQVLVDWEPDPTTGDILLRPELLRRLVAFTRTSRSREVICRSRRRGGSWRVSVRSMPSWSSVWAARGGSSCRMTLRLRGRDLSRRRRGVSAGRARSGAVAVEVSAEVTAREGSPRTSPARRDRTVEPGIAAAEPAADREARRHTRSAAPMSRTRASSTSTSATGTR